MWLSKSAFPVIARWFTGANEAGKARWRLLGRFLSFIRRERKTGWGGVWRERREAGNDRERKRGREEWASNVRRNNYIYLLLSSSLAIPFLGHCAGSFIAASVILQPWMEAAEMVNGPWHHFSSEWANPKQFLLWRVFWYSFCLFFVFCFCN